VSPHSLWCRNVDITISRDTGRWRFWEALSAG